MTTGLPACPLVHKQYHQEPRLFKSFTFASCVSNGHQMDISYLNILSCQNLFQRWERRGRGGFPHMFISFYQLENFFKRSFSILPLSSHWLARITCSPLAHWQLVSRITMHYDWLRAVMVYLLGTGYL